MIPTIPAPESRVPVSLYTDLRAWQLVHDAKDATEMLAWCAADKYPRSPEKLAAEIIWIILCAGRSAQAARTIEAKVWRAINENRPVVEAFGYRAKAAAIERAWREREPDYATFTRVAASGSPEALVEWCGSIPFIDDTTRFQLAKNFGAQCPKPDIWLSRLAGIPDKPLRSVKIRFPACMNLCRMLADATGDSIAVVDSLLWLGCNKGVLVTDADAGPVLFAPRQVTARSIYESAPEKPANGSLFGEL
jgi:hypothetical protein